MQATGVTRTDFLQKVRRFQEREADQGRPVAVLVTSRTAVADCATLPPSTPVLRLEPFDEAQIRTWIGVWNRGNADTFKRHGLQPMRLECALRYRELAEQPLLLLMLALYGASTENGLTNLTALDPIDVYEQLLTEFARRELSKDGDTTDLDARVERELERLSFIAFAMFNRRSQWVEEGDLTADFLALKLDALPDQRGLRAPLTPGQRAVGRFFFIHDARATWDGRVSHTYEFLHATFNEYLIARLVARELARLTTDAPRRTVDDAMLHAVLSFECLAAREPIVEFLDSCLARHAPACRRAMAEILVALHDSALLPRTESAFAAYTPRQANVVERHAAWSANLVLLATVANGKLSASRLFANAGEEPVREWHRHAGLWQSMLHSAGWDGLVERLDIERGWLGDRREIVLRPSREADSISAPDLRWTFDMPPGSTSYPDNFLNERVSAIRKTHFIADVRDDVMAHDLWPIRARSAKANNFYVLGDNPASETNVLLSALMAPDNSGAAPYVDLINVLLAQDCQGRYVMEDHPMVIPALTVILAGSELGRVSGQEIAPLGELPYLATRLTDPSVQRLFDRLHELFPDEFPPDLNAP